MRPGAFGHSLLIAVIVVLLSGAALPARAQPDADRATAMSLFQAGRKLMQEGSFQEACPKFEAAQQLVPGVGTQFNLAECYVKLGKLASAWVNYVEVARATKAAGQASRSAAAQKKADELQGRLSTLQVDVMAPVDNIAVSINGKEIPRGQWGTAVAKDPGRYTVEASADGYASQSYVAAVGAEGQKATITITPMKKAEGSPAEEPVDPEPDPDGGDDGSSFELETLGVVGIVLAGVGVVALIAGGAMLSSASSDIDEADVRCPDRTQCTDPTARELGNDGVNMQNASYGVLAAGGAVLVAGVILFVVDATNDSGGGAGSADRTSLRIDPVIGQHGAALSVGASF